MLKIVFKIAKGGMSKDTAKVEGLEGSQANKGAYVANAHQQGG
jgi:hypothetical protein